MSICSGTEPEEVPRIGKELYILPSAYDRLIPHMSVVLGVSTGNAGVSESWIHGVLWERQPWPV